MKISTVALMSAALIASLSAASAETLTIAGRDGAYANAMRVAVEAFRAANPDVEIESLELTGGGLRDAVTLAMREASPTYDVILMDDPWAPEFMKNGWLANLDELGGGVDDDFVEVARNVSRYPVGTGPYYAIPHVGNVEMFAYNKAIFEKNGLSAPTSWSDVLAAARTISEAGDGTAGVVFRGKKANPIVTGFLPILWAFGGDVVDADGKAALDSDAAQKALELFLELAEYAPQGVVTYDATEVRDALQQGTAAMSIEVWPAWVPSLDDATVSKVVGDVEIMPAPGEVEGPSPMLGSWLVAIPEASDNKETARRFVDFLTSAEMQKRLALEVGTPPTRASVYADPEVVKAYRWYPAQIEALNHAEARPRIEQWAEVEAILGDELQFALIGELEPAEALAEANERVTEALAK